MGSTAKKKFSKKTTAPANTFVWVYKKETYISTPESRCMFCLKIAVVRLTGAILDEQTDGTTHVCHPSVGGCNHGFTENDLEKAAGT